MTAQSKNLYFDLLDDIVDKYNNTQHTTIKMKPDDVKFGSYAEYSMGSYVRYVRSNLGIFRHPFSPCTLLNNRMTS